MGARPDVKQGTCDVCALLDGDRAHKTVGYCGTCNAWMCESCRDSPARRARAAGKRAFGSLMLGLKGKSHTHKEDE
jgi:hypothetical protein